MSKMTHMFWTMLHDSRHMGGIVLSSIVWCFFQPKMMAMQHLHGDGEPLKEFFRKLVQTGLNGRYIVLQVLIPLLSVVWRHDPASAFPYRTDIMQLCSYREPLDGGWSGNASTAGSAEFASLTTHAEPIAVEEKAKTMTRIFLYAFLEDLPVVTEAARHFVRTMVTGLMKFVVSGPEMDKDYMPNSGMYGIRLRTWQTLCILMPKVDETMLPTILPLLWKALRQRHQSTVRHHIELTAISMCVRFPSSHEDVCEQLKQERRGKNSQFISSLVIILGYSLQHLKMETRDRGGEERVEAYVSLRSSAIRELVCWLGSVSAHIRAMTQCILLDLMPGHVEDMKADAKKRVVVNTTAQDQQSSGGGGVTDVDYLTSTLAFLQSNPDVVKVVKKQKRNFVLDPKSTAEERACHPANIREAVTLKALLSAKLTFYGEFEPLSTVERVKQSLAALYAEIFPIQKYSYKRQDGRTVYSATDPNSSPDGHQHRHGEDVVAAVGEQASLGGVQRKILPFAWGLDGIPTKQANPWTANEALSLQTSTGAGRPRHDVVVCASLVDKLPNLAGLARTCEIFAAKRLVVPDIRIVDDVLFQQISVTANKWMPTEEVKPEALYAWLKDRKKEGFTLVGLEQTTTSSCLSKYQFPSKCILLLGDEKEGVPAELLALLDAQIEIPQMGILRSLNVHVSGAICLWEYTKQHL
jgi:tRNA guanosine-2'-O-methyltransferase